MHWRVKPVEQWISESQRPAPKVFAARTLNAQQSPVRLGPTRHKRKSPAFTLVSMAIALIVTSTHAQAAKPIKEATPIEAPIPKGAVHIVATAGDKDFKKVFTYFPYPPLPMDVRNRIRPLKRAGVYRIEVDPQGKVAAVTILKSSGRSMDYSALKTFNRWKAKPGPLRVVDVTFTLHAYGASWR